nr:unnamed protein product [Digitaria exilis]
MRRRRLTSWPPATESRRTLDGGALPKRLTELARSTSASVVRLMGTDPSGHDSPVAAAHSCTPASAVVPLGLSGRRWCPLGRAGGGSSGLCPRSLGWSNAGCRCAATQSMRAEEVHARTCLDGPERRLVEATEERLHPPVAPELVAGPEPLRLVRRGGGPAGEKQQQRGGEEREDVGGGGHQCGHSSGLSSCLLFFFSQAGEGEEYIGLAGPPAARL